LLLSVKMKKNEEQPVLGKCTNMMLEIGDFPVVYHLSSSFYESRSTKLPGKVNNSRTHVMEVLGMKF